MGPTTQASEEGKAVTATPGSVAKLSGKSAITPARDSQPKTRLRLVLEGFRKEIPISDLCRREGISTTLYYSWLKDFMEAGNAYLKGDTLRDARKAEVKEIREENARLKELVGEPALQIQLMKKSLNL